MGLRVEEDPTDNVDGKLDMKRPGKVISAMDVFDPAAAQHKSLFSSKDGREDKEDEPVDVFADYDHDSDEEDAKHRARLASLSFSLNDPGHKEIEKSVKFKMDQKTHSPHASKDVASVSLMWSYSHKEQLEERKRMEKLYGTLDKDKKIKTYAHKSPHVQKASPTLKIKTKFEKDFGSLEEPTKRLISAKDRIKIQVRACELRRTSQ